MMPERIRHVIFLDALVPEDGESGFDLLGQELAMALEDAAADFTASGNCRTIHQM